MPTERHSSHDRFASVRNRLPESHQARVGVVLGTGLGRWAEQLTSATSIPYSEIDGFPVSTVHTHSGRLLAGWLGTTPVLALQGRFHLYEGYSASQVAQGIRLLAELGVQRLVLTNAAGAINPNLSLGSIMVLSDHINMTGHNPLRGANDESQGPRFPDMSAVYPARLQNLAVTSGLELGLRLERGVYCGVMGPSLETPAETRAFRQLGADAVGMSTVIEAIAAKHAGLQILGLSCLTNINLPDCMEETSFEVIVEQAERTGRDLSSLLTVLTPRLASDVPAT